MWCASSSQGPTAYPADRMGLLLSEHSSVLFPSGQLLDDEFPLERKELEACSQFQLYQCINGRKQHKQAGSSHQHSSKARVASLNTLAWLLAKNTL